jgi:hypothetical protein
MPLKRLSAIRPMTRERHYHTSLGHVDARLSAPMPSSAPGPRTAPSAPKTPPVRHPVAPRRRSFRGPLTARRPSRVRRPAVRRGACGPEPAMRSRRRRSGSVGPPDPGRGCPEQASTRHGHRRMHIATAGAPRVLCRWPSRGWVRRACRQGGFSESHAAGYRTARLWPPARTRGPGVERVTFQCHVGLPFLVGPRSGPDVGPGTNYTGSERGHLVYSVHADSFEMSTAFAWTVIHKRMSLIHWFSSSFQTAGFDGQLAC